MGTKLSTSNAGPATTGTKGSMKTVAKVASGKVDSGGGKKK